MRARLPLLSAVVLLAVLPLPTFAGQGAAHPGEYAPADIAYGSRLYDAQCTTCHGANGDGVGGVDLRSGKFRNAVTDQDLVRVITTGIQGTGMQAFRLDPSETRRHHRLPAQHEHLRSRHGQGGRCACVAGCWSRPRPGARTVTGSARKAHESRRISSDIGAVRSAGIAAAHVDRAVESDDADQSPRADRHWRRQGRQRPPAERGHLLRPTDGRSGTAGVAGEGRYPRVHHPHRFADAVVPRIA